MRSSHMFQVRQLELEKTSEGHRASWDQQKPKEDLQRARGEDPRGPSEDPRKFHHVGQSSLRREDLGITNATPMVKRRSGEGVGAAKDPKTLRSEGKLVAVIRL